MQSLYILIPVALLFCALALKLFIWAVDNRQFEDLERESKRILEDDDEH